MVGTLALKVLRIIAGLFYKKKKWTSTRTSFQHGLLLAFASFGEDKTIIVLLNNRLPEQHVELGLLDTCKPQLLIYIHIFPFFPLFNTQLESSECVLVNKIIFMNCFIDAASTIWPWLWWLLGILQCQEINFSSSFCLPHVENSYIYCFRILFIPQAEWAWLTITGHYANEYGGNYRWAPGLFDTNSNGDTKAL